MRTLILGGTGLLGQALGRQLPHAQRVSRFQCDLTQESVTHSFFLNTAPLETVYFAAGLVGGIEDNMARPADYLEANVRMGLNALKYASRVKARRFINISSACAFPALAQKVSSFDLWEGRPAESNAPYGIAKRVIAEATSQYRHQHKLNAITIFLPNLYGAAPRRDPAQLHVLPAIIERVRRAIENGDDTVTLRGTGEEQRELMFVKDAARAVIDIGASCTTQDMVTAGTGRVWRVAEIAAAVKEALNWSGTFVFNPALPAGQPYRAMHLDFKFPPQTDLQEHIRGMVTEDAQRAEAAAKPRSVHEPVRASQSVAVATP